MSSFSDDFIYQIFVMYHTKGMYAAEIADVLNVTRTFVGYVLKGKQYPHVKARWEADPSNVVDPEIVSLREKRARMGRLSGATQRKGSTIRQEGSFVIYGLVDPRDNEVRYVGKTARNLDQRLREHLERKQKNEKGRWFDELEQLGLTPYIKPLSETLPTLQDANVKEKRLIAEYKMISKKPLFNILKGGDGGKQSPDVLERIRQTQKTKFADPDYKARMLDALRTPDAIANLRAAQNDPESAYRTQRVEKIRRWAKSEECRTQRSANQKARMSDPRVRSTISRKITDNNGKIWASLRECSEDLGVTPTAICKAIRLGKPCKGVMLRYGDDKPGTAKDKTKLQRRVVLSDGREFESLKVCGEALGLHPNTVERALREGRKLMGLYEIQYCDKLPRYRCRETGEVFETLTAIAIRLGFDTKTISKAIRESTSVGGYRFEQVA